MDKVEVKLKKSKMTTTEKLILTLWLSCGVAAIVLLLVYLKIITSFIGILGLLSVSSLVIAFVLFLAKNIKIVPYDEKKHGGTSEIGGYIESDPRKFDYIFGAIRDH
ncbi:hypothetical protein B6662_09050 [Campylobacter jejuni]|uniref:hypothetical protein n=1 Tax=Campylobacter TaxID=194 RepID=UPI00069A98BE|nr:MULTISPECIES: hypothetical protein [Campylobacter]OEW12583.1 hypothetical protein AJ935_09300 [Campylobacter sp. BCW_6876]APA47400.1 hypothetical protein BLD42_05210 [Campylobacter jejuni]APB39621.1 hypothetical protein BLD40_05430 [Campylobacter jejuni]APB41385.1 hypothetical protein BLD41_05380 [Campylobacter jejuni]AVS37458.1 hypothetical protein C9J79_07675 [Campylobacter jejuni]